jgi:hypothetical protein
VAKPYALGIDLGTSNSAAAFLSLDGGAEAAASEPVLLPVPQLTAANARDERALLPSASYLPHPDEFAGGLPALPWDADSAPETPPVLRGVFAREHGAMIPDRLVTSAKSWLSNPHVDPRSPVLPWGSDLSAAEKLSPLAASAGYLRHLKEAFLASPAAREAGWAAGNGETVVTVPASFDEAARRLTLEAAAAAGWGDVVLLEEPQAAFYAWTARAGASWRHQVAPGDVVLVCDVGGGTADFSLLAMTGREGQLEIERIAVGEHLLLGGDNMDLALAYTLRAKLSGDGKEIDAWQFLSLIQSCRRAKEELFADAALERVSLTIPSRGSSLFAKSLAVTLDRAVLEGVVLDGFLPFTAVTDLPAETGQSGLREFGLPYASDPVVSKHLARFLTRALQNVRASADLAALVAGRPELVSGDHLVPTAVLFNGGVFKPAATRRRVLDLLASWDQNRAPRELEGAEPDLAVAKGAAVYAANRATGRGLRIKAGTARSYYLGLESSMPAIPGFQPPLKAVCVVPQGMEEGSECVLPGREFGLVTGREATFRFFSSEVRSGDEPGAVVDDAARQLEETASLTVSLPARPGAAPGELVPVRLQAQVTELGNLELWMRHPASEQRWKLDFQVRTQ